MSAFLYFLAAIPHHPICEGMSSDQPGAKLYLEPYNEVFEYQQQLEQQQ
jgi:hypothetical protein